MCNLDWWALFRTHCLSAVSDREYCSHVETTTYINTYHPICFTPEVAQTVQSSNVAKTLNNAALDCHVRRSKNRSSKFESSLYGKVAVAIYTHPHFVVELKLG